MIQRLKQLWKDPVWSKVIATAIMLGVGALVPFLFNVIPQINLLGSVFWDLLLLQFSIRVWMILIVVIIVISAIILIKRFKKSTKIGFLKYTKDTIYGIDWNWKWSAPSVYNNNSYSIVDLQLRCPTCCSELDTNGNYRNLVTCINEECSWRWTEQFNLKSKIFSINELKRKAENVIDRKRHNKEYK